MTIPPSRLPEDGEQRLTDVANEFAAALLKTLYGVRQEFCQKHSLTPRELDAVMASGLLANANLFYAELLGWDKAKIFEIHTQVSRIIHSSGVTDTEK